MASLFLEIFSQPRSLSARAIFWQGFMRRLARWIRVVVLDPDASLFPR